MQQESDTCNTPLLLLGCCCCFGMGRGVVPKSNLEFLACREEDIKVQVEMELQMCLYQAIQGVMVAENAGCSSHNVRMVYYHSNAWKEKSSGYATISLADVQQMYMSKNCQMHGELYGTELSTQWGYTLNT